MFDNKMYICFQFCDKEDKQIACLRLDKPLYIDEFTSSDLERYIDKVWKYLHKNMCKDLDKKWREENNEESELPF